MIFDKENLFSEDQEVLATAASTNIIDLGADDSAAPTANEKGDIKVLVQVTTTYASGTSVQAALQTDDNAGFSSAASLVTTAAIAVESLTAGYQFAIMSVPRNLAERYLRMYYTVVGTPTAGNITAGLVFDVQTNV